MKITPTGAALGARIHDIDLNQPISDGDFRLVLCALGEHGVLCFPGQDLTVAAQTAFGSRFGELEVNIAASLAHEPGHLEMMILSNMKKDGQPVGLHDAGQDWHTDMSYSKDVALANILHARHVPMRNGRPLGETQFRNMHAAYEHLPDALKVQLEGRTATHDFNKYWDLALTRPAPRASP